LSMRKAAITLRGLSPICTVCYLVLNEVRPV
jgi:hypothetical protein